MFFFPRFGNKKPSPKKPRQKTWTSKMGVSLNGVPPISHPKFWSFLEPGKPVGLLGSTWNYPPHPGFQSPFPGLFPFFGSGIPKALNRHLWRADLAAWGPGGRPQVPPFLGNPGRWSQQPGAVYDLRIWWGARLGFGQLGSGSWIQLDLPRVVEWWMVGKFCVVSTKKNGVSWRNIEEIAILKW